AHARERAVVETGEQVERGHVPRLHPPEPDLARGRPGGRRPGIGPGKVARKLVSRIVGDRRALEGQLTDATKMPGRLPELAQQRLQRDRDVSASASAHE